MKRLSLVLLVLMGMRTPALAQAPQPGDRQSHFGVIFTFSPTSTVRDEAKEFMFDANHIDIHSKDFEIGFVVRGREQGGDWGVWYVQKSYEDGSTIDNTFESCFQDGCFTGGYVDTMHDVRLRGLFIHKFAPFVTIKRRVQIGLNFGGGFARAKGTAERRETGLDFVGNQIVQTQTVTQVDAREIFFDGRKTIPLWKLEVMGAFIVAPGLKVKAGAGLNFLNYPAASVAVTYLFGQ